MLHDTLRDQYVLIRVPAFETDAISIDEALVGIRFGDIHPTYDGYRAEVLDVFGIPRAQLGLTQEGRGAWATISEPYLMRAEVVSADTWKARKGN